MKDDIKLPPLPERWEPKLREFVQHWGSAAIKADRQHHDRMAVAHEWIRSSLGLNEDAPYRFDYYAQEIESLKADRHQLWEPVAWQYWDGTFWVTTIDPKGHRINGRAVRPLYAAPQPPTPAREYKKCRHCGFDCKPPTDTTGWHPLVPAQEPSVGQIMEAVKSYGAVCRKPNTTVSEQEMRLHEIHALLARYGSKS